MLIPCHHNYVFINKKKAQIEPFLQYKLYLIDLLNLFANQLAKCKSVVSTTLQFELSSMQDVVKKSNFNAS